MNCSLTEPHYTAWFVWQHSSNPGTVEIQDTLWPKAISIGWIYPASPVDKLYHTWQARQVVPTRVSGNTLQKHRFFSSFMLAPTCAKSFLSEPPPLRVYLQGPEGTGLRLTSDSGEKHCQILSIEFYIEFCILILWSILISSSNGNLIVILMLWSWKFESRYICHLTTRTINQWIAGSLFETKDQMPTKWDSLGSRKVRKVLRHEVSRSLTIPLVR